MPGDPDESLAKLFRDYADRWEIEKIPAGTQWIAIDRNTSGDYIRVVPARNIQALRFRLDHPEPEEREHTADSNADHQHAAQRAARPPRRGTRRPPSRPHTR